MKYFYSISVLFLCITNIANAQINQGKWLVIGGISGSKSDLQINQNTDRTFSSFGLNVLAGKAVKTNVVVGGIVGTSITNDKRSMNGNQFAHDNINNATVGVFARHYKPLGKGFHVFAQSSLSSNFGRTKADALGGRSVVSRTFGIGVGIAPGISYQVLRKLQVELVANNLLNAQYSQTKLLNQNAVTDTDNYFSAGSSLSTGGGIGVLQLGFSLLL